MRKNFLMLIIIFLIIGVSALTVQKDTAVDLSHPVRINDFPSSAINCNISVFDPDNIELVDFEIMTNQFEKHNYTVAATNNSKLGIYTYDITCTTSLSNKTESFSYEVTATGDKVSLSNIIIVIVFLVLCIAFLYLGSIFENDKWMVKTAFYLFAILMGVLAVNSGRIIASESTDLSTMATTGFVLVIAVLLFMFMYIFVHATVQAFKQIKHKKEVRWNY